MNTTQLQCFVTVADTLNFLRASEQLNLSQPAVSQQIRNLEEELGVRLFNRTTRSVTLTQEGKRFLKDAKNILLISEQARESLARPQDPEWRELILGCHTYWDVSRMVPALGKLRERYPELYPAFRVLPFQHLFRGLENDEIDGIVCFRDSRRHGKEIEYTEFAQIPVCAVFRENDFLAEKEILRPEDLAGSRLIFIDFQKCPDELARVYYDLEERRPAPEIYFCESAESALALAQAGFGAAVFPDIHAWGDPSMRSVPLAGTDPVSYGAYCRNPEGNLLLKEFVELSLEEWGNQ